MLITGSVPEEDQEVLVLISLAASCFRHASEQAFKKAVRTKYSATDREGRRGDSPFSPSLHVASDQQGYGRCQAGAEGECNKP